MIKRLSSVILCLGLAIIAFVAVVVGCGRNPSEVLWTLATGGATSPYGLTEAIVKAIPVLLCAIAAAIPGRLGLTNIGGEGQLLVGAIGATFAALNFGHLPSPLPLIMMGLFAATLGGLWGLLPGALRAITKSNEIVITLLLNYVASLILLQLIHGTLKDPGSLGWPQSAAFPESARLSGMWGTRVHDLLWVGVGSCVALSFLARRTVVGMKSRVIGANPRVAHYIGVNVSFYYIAAFCIAGFFAGLGGFGEVAGIQGRLREGISLGYGYGGFFVAWLCRNRFEWLPVGAMVYSLVITGADSLQVVSGMPFATVYLLQGLLFLAVLASGPVELFLWRSAVKNERL